MLKNFCDKYDDAEDDTVKSVAQALRKHLIEGVSLEKALGLKGTQGKDRRIMTETALRRAKMVVKYCHELRSKTRAVKKVASDENLDDPRKVWEAIEVLEWAIGWLRYMARGEGLPIKK